jgi:carbon-monoxide dehydrogenase small subunit
MASNIRGTANMAKIHVSTTINGAPTEYLCDPNQTLLDVLRDNLGLTGSKEGCGSGDCGACSVTITPAGLLLPRAGAEAEGIKIETIEGHGRRRQAASAAEEVRRDGRAPVRHLHAGFPGGVEGAAGQEPEPDRDPGPLLAGRQSLPLHRYDKIVTAVMDVAAELRGAAK